MAATFTVKLLQGDTEITSWVQELTADLTTYTHDLTTEECDAITDWHALRYSFIATDDQAKVTFAELQAPLASPGGSPTPSGSESASYSPSGSESGSASASPDNPTLDFELHCGATLVASYSLSLSTDLATYTKTLSPEELARVTDWADLSYTFRADGRQAKITWAELSAGEYAGSASESASASASASGSASESGSPSASASGSPSRSASASESASESASWSLGTYSLTLQLYALFQPLSIARIKHN
jgi:hypothetical protein